MLGSVLFWLLGSSSDYNKVPGLVKSHSVREGRQTGKDAEMPREAGRDVWLTNEVQDGKDQAWPPRRDWLTNARSLEKVEVWPCECLRESGPGIAKRPLCLQHSGKRMAANSR